MQLQAGVGFFRPKTTDPLACNCETGWVSSSFSLRQRTTTSHVGLSSSSASICTHNNPTTHPLACNCETGWVFIIIFFESTNTNDDDEPCRLVVVICLHRRPPMSHYNLLGALSPPPPATPASSTPNESLRLFGGSLSPSTCDTSLIDPLLSSSPLSLVASVLYK